MNARHAFILFLLLFALAGFSQLSKQQKLDSLRTKFRADSTKMHTPKKYSLMAGFDTRNSFVSADKKISVKLQGVKAGVTILCKHHIAVGYYSVVNLPQKEVIDEAGTKYNLKLNMEYLTLYYQYVLLNTKRWEIGFPVELGGGNYHTTAIDTGGKKYKPFTDTLRTGISLFGAGFDVSFKIFRWLGFNAMGGYRFVGGPEPQGMNFNGVFYSVGFEIYFGQLYKMAKFGLKRRGYRKNVEKVNKLPD
jgi:hypothetical protein